MKRCIWFIIVLFLTKDVFAQQNEEEVWIVEPKFDYAEVFSDNIALVRVDGKYGYIDMTGAYRIFPRFKFACSFNDGLAVYSNNGIYWGVIDIHGCVVVQPIYDKISSFVNDVAWAKKGLIEGFIDRGDNLFVLRHIIKNNINY